MNVLISGAGVAGSALAYWLHRYGCNVTIVERAVTPQQSGYAVDFRGASLLILQRMGVLEAVRRAETGMGAVSYVDAAGRRLAKLPAESMSGEVEILRGDLMHILYNATQDTTEYRFDDSIADVQQNEAGVEVTLASGGSRTYDLVIGADGLHSIVRSLVFGEENRFLDHLGYYVAIFTLDNYLGLDHTGLYYNVPGKVSGIFSARHNAEARGAFWFTAPKLDVHPSDIDSQKRLLVDVFADQKWEVPRLLEAMREAHDFYFDSVSQVRLPQWSSGRVALLGDAAFGPSPLSGLGTSLAVIGAYVLAGELASAGGDHSVAFPEYQQLMGDAVERSHEVGRQGASWFMPHSRKRLWFRNQSLRLLPYMPWKGLITAGPSKAANAVTIKDYSAVSPRI